MSVVSVIIENVRGTIMSESNRLIGKDLSYSYSKGVKVIEKCTIELTTQEKLGLVAPSGYGKTTLCKLLSGYLEPFEGSVLFDGKPLKEYKGYCPIQMIWQHPEQAVNPKLKMKKILAEANNMEPEILDILGIENEWFERYPSELSGGELQRFCIARAIGEQTRILIADEITTMMDLVTQCQIWNALLQITAKRKIGMLIVSHDMELLKQVADRILLL